MAINYYTDSTCWNTFYVGTLKGVGRIYQQTYVDTYCKVAQAKLYTTKTSITAADMLSWRSRPLGAYPKATASFVMVNGRMG